MKEKKCSGSSNVCSSIPTFMQTWVIFYIYIFIFLLAAIGGNFLLLSFSFFACKQRLKGTVYPLATGALSKYYFHKNVFGGDFVYSVIVTPVCLTVDAYVL